ncbi:hypothetical protein [Actinoplanes subglobosus]|uniref:Uncharacterized protein n=1 Tax=Actinoplanes subglobosus TaxID=1547892 RepID=A0ABV8J6G6_9ACTN
MLKPNISSGKNGRKMSGSTLAVAFAAGAVAFAGVPSPAVAQDRIDYWCYGCFVLAAGPQADTGKVSVLLLDPKKGFGGERGKEWFDARKSPDRILATALAALTSGKTVSVNVAARTKDSAIDRIYLERAPEEGGS